MERGCVSELRASHICWDLAPAPWLSSDRVRAVAIKVLPAVEQLALALVDRDEELKSVRTLLSAVLEVLHASEAKTTRLRQRVAELLDARRREVSG